MVDYEDLDLPDDLAARVRKWGDTHLESRRADVEEAKVIALMIEQYLGGRAAVWVLEDTGLPTPPDPLSGMVRWSDTPGA